MLDSAPQPRKNARRCPWTEEEDKLLIKIVNEFGEHSWTKVSTYIPNRNCKQCRERWVSKLRPNLSKEEWTPEEERRLIELQAKFGNNWTSIAMDMTDRSPIALKNRFRLLMRHSRKFLMKNVESLFDVSLSAEIEPIDDYIFQDFFVEPTF